MAAMETSSSPQIGNSEWLIHVPDFPEAKDRRAAVFPQHIERMKTDPQGFWVFGGATLAEPVGPGQTPHITGSAMLVFAPTRERVLARLMDDPLVKEKIWDIEKAQIHPFLRPKRTPL
ncbi:Dimeric alpha-beta barrel [Colletotrichum scovillei]|uniref:Dimeric alpha-beta barrel n=2 Tax=Colletotrichum scovillei TaxID=1209932 RepID=A0A9P7QWF8_9PEZI|nr:Dimeric alpha-beta barrel [Colletotrichum scovillei]KAG7049156.1 Dimeric alpha-beta barrel [Colletotrichum scovillei]KAG7063899.1 Dimeric alpha-beta barrel [Colletotrichum scovillei]